MSVNLYVVMNHVIVLLLLSWYRIRLKIPVLGIRILKQLHRCLILGFRET